MASFQNNIFISYAHADNGNGWVDAFHASLENWLRILGVEARIWRDRKLSGADAFSDEILDQLKQSALLISILSPNGMRSNWCEKERQKFEQYAQANGGFRVGNVVRALKVVITPADQDAHRTVFGTIGYEFFEKDSQTGRYDHYLPSDPRFEKHVDGLAQEIKGILQTVAAADLQPVKAAVYVAEVSSDLEPDRTKIVDQLSAWGYRVLPAEPLPIHSATLRAQVRAAMEGAVLSVHLLSDKRGAIPDEEDESIIALQYGIASGRGLDRIVWVSPDMQPHAFVEAAIQAGSPNGLERLEGRNTIEDVKEILAAKLKGLDESSRVTSDGSPKLNIYVMCDQRDLPAPGAAEGSGDALILKSFLDRRGFCAWLPPANVVDPRVRDKDHRETLKMSDAVILYWGAADEAWFRGTLRELTKARSTTRKNRPFAAEAIYFSRPPRQEKALYHAFLDLAIEQFEDFRPAALGPFLERLRKTRVATAP